MLRLVSPMCFTTNNNYFSFFIMRPQNVPVWSDGFDKFYYILKI